MLPKDIEQLVIEVFAHEEPEDVREDVKRQPEVYLKSLLETIKQELPHVWAMLKNTLDKASTRPYIKSCDERIAREKTLLKTQHTHKPLHRKKIALS